MAAPRTRPYGEDVIADLLRPWRTAATWRQLCHLSMDLWIGTVTFSVLFTLAVTAASMVVIFPAALLVAVLALWLAGVAARIERSRVRALLDPALADPEPLTRATGLWQRLINPFRHRQRWKELAYGLVHFPLGLVTTSSMVLLWGGSIGLIALPLYSGSLPEDAVRFGLFDVRAGAAWIISIAALGVLVLVAPWVTVALASVDLALARRLLSRPPEEELEARVVELESSRVAAVDSAEAERRRIERDLHDGAQQRLIAVAMDLGVAKERLATDPEAGRVIVDRAHEEVKAALKELRDLVRGIHPVILEDRGLDAALSAVVARSPVPVRLHVDVPVRPVPTVESAAYFMVSEALANVARHSGATTAQVDVVRTGDRLRIRVWDDGVGGADANRGSGLRGLSERVAALGGWMDVNSPVGGPTVIDVEVPCGS